MSNDGLSLQASNEASAQYQFQLLSLSLKFKKNVGPVNIRWSLGSTTVSTSTTSGKGGLYVWNSANLRLTDKLNRMQKDGGSVMKSKKSKIVVFSQKKAPEVLGYVELDLANYVSVSIRTCDLQLQIKRSKNDTNSIAVLKASLCTRWLGRNTEGEGHTPPNNTGISFQRRRSSDKMSGFHRRRVSSGSHTQIHSYDESLGELTGRVLQMQKKRTKKFRNAGLMSPNLRVPLRRVRRTRSNNQRKLELSKIQKKSQAYRWGESGTNYDISPSMSLRSSPRSVSQISRISRRSGFDSVHTMTNKSEISVIHAHIAHLKTLLAKSKAEFKEKDHDARVAALIGTQLLTENEDLLDADAKFPLQLQQKADEMAEIIANTESLRNEYNKLLNINQKLCAKEAFKKNSNYLSMKEWLQSELKGKPGEKTEYTGVLAQDIQRLQTQIDAERKENVKNIGILEKKVANLKQSNKDLEIQTKQYHEELNNTNTLQEELEKSETKFADLCAEYEKLQLGQEATIQEGINAILKDSAQIEIKLQDDLSRERAERIVLQAELATYWTDTFIDPIMGDGSGLPDFSRGLPQPLSHFVDSDEDSNETASESFSPETFPKSLNEYQEETKRLTARINEIQAHLASRTGLVKERDQLKATLDERNITVAEKNEKLLTLKERLGSFVDAWNASCKESEQLGMEIEVATKGIKSKDSRIKQLELEIREREQENKILRNKSAKIKANVTNCPNKHPLMLVKNVDKSLACKFCEKTGNKSLWVCHTCQWYCCKRCEITGGEKPPAPRVRKKTVFSVKYGSIKYSFS